MTYDFTQFKKKIIEIEEWFKKELSQIRTGRATPIILDSISVESYGSYMGINQLAGITIEDPKTIRVVPWDMTQVKNIEKAVTDSNLGLSVSVDDRGLRIIFPELTSERRVSLAKIAKQKLEEARVSLRQEREGVREDIQEKEKKGGVGEDDKFRFNAELQKYVDEANKKLDELAERKEKEILE